jgi:predicted kinase
LLIVTGPAGVGKSTVSRMVASSVAKSVHLRIDDFLWSVVGGYVHPWLPEAREQNEVIGGAVIAAAMQFLAAGYTVVVDGTVFPDSLEELGRACVRRGVPLHYVVLRADLATCVDRAASRNADGTDAKQIADVHARFETVGPHERHVVEAVATAEEVAAAVLASFRAGRLASTHE